MTIIAELIACIAVLWLYEVLYDGEPWYEHVMFWAFAVGLAGLWLLT